MATLTLAETTPVTEAAQLQADLRRAGIEPFAWVINSSLVTSGTTDPLLRQRIVSERSVADDHVEIKKIIRRLPGMWAKMAKLKEPLEIQTNGGVLGIKG